MPAIADKFKPLCYPCAIIALLANKNACTGILEAFTGPLGAADCTLKIVIGSNEARVPLYGTLKEMYISA